MGGSRASVIGGGGAAGSIELPRSRETYHLQSVAFYYTPDWVGDPGDRGVLLELLSGTVRLQIFALPAPIVLADDSTWVQFGAWGVHDSAMFDAEGYKIFSAALPEVEVRPEMKLRIVFIGGLASDTVGAVTFLTDEALV